MPSASPPAASMPAALTVAQSLHHRLSTIRLKAFAETANTQVNSKLHEHTISSIFEEFFFAPWQGKAQQNFLKTNRQAILKGTATVFPVTHDACSSGLYYAHQPFGSQSYPDFLLIHIIPSDPMPVPTDPIPSNLTPTDAPIHTLTPAPTPDATANHPFVARVLSYECKTAHGVMCFNDSNPLAKTHMIYHYYDYKKDKNIIFNGGMESLIEEPLRIGMNELLDKRQALIDQIRELDKNIHAFGQDQRCADSWFSLNMYVRPNFSGSIHWDAISEAKAESISSNVIQQLDTFLLPSA